MFLQKFNSLLKFSSRVDDFSRLLKAHSDSLESLSKPRAIQVFLPGEQVVHGEAFKTTILSVLPKSLIKTSLVARVEYLKKEGSLSDQVIDLDDTHDVLEAQSGQLWDLTRPLEGDCRVELLTWEDEAAKRVFWHSSAHILGAGIEMQLNGQLATGPATKTGFFYDFVSEKKIKAEDLDQLSKEIAKLSANAKFERLIVSRKDALSLFKDSPFKREIISSRIPPDGLISVYRIGSFIDLCTGPHLPSTSYVKAVKLNQVSESVWPSTGEHLQRIHGVSFPTPQLLEKHEKLMAELAKRDHRIVGESQNLFFFNKIAPGSAFFTPTGAKIYQKLMQLVSKENTLRGCQEVISPNICHAELWKTSGHFFKYKKNMFFLDIEGEEFGIKPMNCPGHCVLFASKLRSFREMPIRFAEFGVLHRNELSGTLSGLTRVRRFVQDDCHIFCRPDQVLNEILMQLDFLGYLYGILGFKFKLSLSTRPDDSMGSDELWEQAESQLTKALQEFGHPWNLKPKDGAFYGPKIDVTLLDALSREHQVSLFHFSPSDLSNCF